MRISIDGHINQAAQAMYSRSYSELTGEQARALVAKLRGQGLHPEADTLWSWILRDAIAEVQKETGRRNARRAKKPAARSAA
jgi:uncharacterized small protein (DUF1192 family)